MRLRTFALLATLVLPLPLVAQTYNYTYTGNDFTNVFGVSGSYTTKDSVSITFTLSAPLGDNLSGGVAEPSNVTPLTWSFSDGVQTNTSADPIVDYSATYFDFTTNGSGTIVDWFVDDQFGVEGGNEVETLFGFPSGYNQDVGGTSSPNASGDELRNPGIWTVSESSPTSVPEGGPPYAFLLMSGACLCGAGLFRFRKRPGPLTA